MSDKQPIVINLGTGNCIIAGLRMADNGDMALGFGRIREGFNIPAGANVPLDAIAGYDVIVRLPSTEDCRRLQSIIQRIDTQIQAIAQHARIDAEEARQKAVAIKRLAERTDLSFGEAQILMELGYAVSRKGFNKPHRITLQDPEFDEVSTQIYYVITTPSGDVVPWTASQTDLTSKDWYVLHTDITV